MKKFQFKRGQTVAFSPEEGVILTGKVIGMHAYTSTKVKDWKAMAYTVEETDGTLWNCEENELMEVVDAK